MLFNRSELRENRFQFRYYYRHYDYYYNNYIVVVLRIHFYNFFSQYTHQHPRRIRYTYYEKKGVTYNTLQMTEISNFFFIIMLKMHRAQT